MEMEKEEVLIHNYIDHYLNSYLFVWYVCVCQRDYLFCSNSLNNLINFFKQLKI